MQKCMQKYLKIQMQDNKNLTDILKEILQIFAKTKFCKYSVFKIFKRADS